MIDLRSRLPESRAARLFLVVAFIDAAGRGLFLAGGALFYTQVVGLTTAQVGIGVSLAGLCGLVCAVPIGRLADRFGDGRMLVVLQLWRAVGFLAYPFVSDFTWFLVVVCFIGIVDVGVNSIIQSVAGAIAEGESLVRTMALVAVVRNTGYAVSALAATAVITLAAPRGYVWFVLVNAAAFIVSALLLLRIRLPRRQPRHRDTPVRRLPLRDARFLTLSLTNGILYLHVVLLSVVLPLWIVTRTSAPQAVVGVALMINTLMAVGLQVRLSRGGDEIGRAAVLQRRAGLALAAFCVLAALSGLVGPVAATLLLLAAIVAMTYGELWQSAGAWGVSYGLSPEAQRAYYLSVYNLGANAVAVIGPGLLAVAVVDRGTAGWLGLAAVFVVAGVLVPAIAGPARAVTRDHEALNEATEGPENPEQDPIGLS